MALREKVLIKKAEKFELKELQKIIVNQEQLQLLNNILDDSYEIRRPKLSEYKHRKQLIRVINDIAKDIYGKSSSCPVVEEFGSFSMDLFTTESDLDLSINFRNSSLMFPRDQKIKTLRKFARKFYSLQNGGHVRRVQPIMNAKVPIVKVVDEATGVECDLSVENRDGISKSLIIRFITSIDQRFHKLSFLTRDPPILPPFSAILKDGEDLASVKKSVRNFQNFGVQNKESLGELFVSFLIKLASVEKLWPKGLCASPYLGHWTSKTWDTKIASMSVEDFTDRTQNVARAVGKFEVEEIYNQIHHTIKNLFLFMNVKIKELKLKESLFGIAKMLHTCVEPNLHVLQENYETNQHVVTTNPILTMKKRGAPSLSTRQPPAGHLCVSVPQHRTVTTNSGNMWDQQPFDHQPVKRMRVAEAVPATISKRPAWGGPERTQGWSGTPSGGWGGVHGAASMGDLQRS